MPNQSFHLRQSRRIDSANANCRRFFSLLLRIMWRRLRSICFAAQENPTSMPTVSTRDAICLAPLTTVDLHGLQLLSELKLGKGRFLCASGLGMGHSLRQYMALSVS
jgi:hypothetical protein